MSEVSLDLVSAEDLFKELEKRFEVLVVGYCEYEDGEELIKTRWNDGKFIKKVGAAQVLVYDLIESPNKDSEKL